MVICHKSTCYLKRINNTRFGFSLLEVLIALVILSFGLLGTAKLQLTVLKENQNAQHNTNAALLSGQIANQVFANKSAKDSYKLPPTKVIKPFNGCQTIICSDKEIANRNINHWQKRIAQTLPSGMGEIDVNAKQLKVTVRWDADHKGALGLNCPKASSQDLDCLTYIMVLAQ